MNKINKYLLAMLFFGASSAAMSGFIQAAATAPGGTGKSAGSKSASPGNWQQQWETAIREGKKEGSVVVSSTWPPETREVLARAFKERYGIALESSPQGRGAELVPKIQMEQSAGLYLTDFFGGGSTTALNMLKPAGLVASLEPLLILPEVKDPKYWRDEKFPFVDKDKTFIGILAQKQPYIVYNTELVKKGEITTYKDLLKLQYRGKISLNDPSTSGAGASMMTHLAYDLWNMEEARDFLRQLLKNQAVVERDNRIQLESVARGKYSIALGGRLEDLSGFMKVGAPLEVVDVRDGVAVSPAAGGISVPVKLAHPNAARVFLNWLLTKEGSTLFAQTFGGLSMRTDVSTQGILPLFLFKPGEKLFMLTEEKSLNMGKMTGICKQIIEEAGR